MNAIERAKALTLRMVLEAFRVDLSLPTLPRDQDLQITGRTSLRDSDSPGTDCMVNLTLIWEGKGGHVTVFADCLLNQGDNAWTSGIISLKILTIEHPEQARWFRCQLAPAGHMIVDPISEQAARAANRLNPSPPRMSSAVALSAGFRSRRRRYGPDRNR